MIEYSKFDYEIAESPDRTSLNYALDYATYKVFGQGIIMTPGYLNYFLI